MATSMGPPLLPGYSLRVQLFAPNAHGSTDKPIRCFRVVTSPDVTIREFCQEASRIHEINYGEPLAVKKVQDDEGFDITQSEILGSLFATTSVIRVVQASANPSVRDSVPPTSALRFVPNESRKRGREDSVNPDGNASWSSWKPNKRQRVLHPHPDEPLPSREDESEAAGPFKPTRHILGEKIIPDSQESIILGVQKVLNGSRQVRQDLPMIPETPSPSPPPEAHSATNKKQPLADTEVGKSIDHKQNDDSRFLSKIDTLSPLRGASVRAQSHVSNSRAKSASYHIQRATERGTSVSTAATSPLSLDQRNHVDNGVTPTSKRKRPSPRHILPQQNGTSFRSQNEESIYENIVSDDEGSVISTKEKEAARLKNSLRPGLSGTERTNSNFKTPPNGMRRTTTPCEQANAPSELPLTPNSEERKRQQQRKDADEAKKARLAAADQRKKEAEEARQAEELRAAERKRSELEEEEKLQMEEFRRGEAQRKAMVEKAARLQAEREERERKEAEEAQKRDEEARIAREEATENQRRVEARIAREKQVEEVRLAKQKVEEEVQRSREEDDKAVREKQEAAAQELRKAGAEAQKATRRSSVSEGSRHSKSASPAVSRTTPIPTPKPQSSSTSFFPNGRKSALKQSLSSQPLRSSSPAPASSKPTSESPHGVGIEEQIPLPNSLKRKVSFLQEPRKETPIKPPTRILPPKAGTTPQAVTQKVSNPKPGNKSSILPHGKQSNTPIPVPTTLRRSSQERSATPTTQTKTSPPVKPTPGNTKKLLVGNQVLKKYGRAAASQRKELSKPIEQLSVSEAASDDESEEDVPSKSLPKEPSPHKVVPSEIISSNTTIKYELQEPRNESEDEDEGEDDDEDAEVDEDETQSHNTSPRDSRSPVTFSQHPEITDNPKSQGAAQPETGSVSEEDEEADSDDASEEEQEEEDEESKSASEESEDEESEEEEEPKVQVPKSSPPELPAHKQPIKTTRAFTGTKPSQNNSKESLSDMSINTQDEVNQQLTSSMYEARSAPTSSVSNPIPASSAAAKPKIGFGASLSSLNAASATLAASSQAKVNSTRRGSQKLQLPQEEEGSEEDEEESDEDDDTSEDEEIELSKGNKRISTINKKSFRVDATEKDSDDSDPDSDNDESVDDEERTRQELLGQIVAITSKNDGNSQGSLPSPKLYRSSTQDTTKTKKAPEKKGNKFLTGYSFSTPA
ncbi:hypothetical protein EG329_009617 [Mollisiaceae sp. DMI_Dod_QoI]|nr:hypothetical protein EG329_009617 [Helotiales sp. DMI_Dod_QoI]